MSGPGCTFMRVVYYTMSKPEKLVKVEPRANGEERGPAPRGCLMITPTYTRMVDQCNTLHVKCDTLQMTCQIDCDLYNG
jgi:hypothetical protein